MSIIIHPNPDLDACACVVLAGVKVDDVHFLPANIELPETCPCCGRRFSGRERILDHPLGEKGRLGANGERHAAACSMPEAAEADPDLLVEVDEQDRTGKVENPRFSLASVLSAIRTEASERGLRGTALDREVVRIMSQIIKGINLNYQKRKAAQDIVAAARIEEVGGFRVALLPQAEVAPQVGIVLNEEHNVSCAIYQQEFNLGVTRYPGREVPDLRLLKPYLSGWFIHSAGFLACWGSRKAPVTALPPAGTPQNREELLALLRRVFGKN